MEDKAHVAEAQFKVLECTKETPSQYNTTYSMKCEDDSGWGYVYWKIKDKKNDPKQYIGKTINVKSGTIKSGERAGQPCGFSIAASKDGKYKNFALTDYAVISVVGEGSVSSKPSGSQSSQSRANYSQPASNVDPKEFCQQKAREWMQVNEWVKDIFGDEYARELVTSICISADRAGVTILKKQFNWKEFVFQKTKLGDMPAEKLANFILFCHTGKISGQSPEGIPYKEVAAAVQEEKKMSAADVFSHLLVKEGIDDDIADAKLLHKWKSREDMSDADYYDALADGDFIEAMKQAQAEKQTSFDEPDVSLD